MKSEEETQYKPQARCRYHHLCGLYNNDVLSSEVEIAMCGRGRSVGADYEPYIPDPKEFKPCDDYAFLPGTVCDAYQRYEDSELIADMVNNTRSAINALDKHGYW